MDRKREIIIQAQEDGLVLLPWIAARYTYHPPEKWERYINEDRIRINNATVVPETILSRGDIITYYPEPVVEPPINREFTVVYEDNDLLVINKPSDLPCHPGGVYFENTLWYILKEKYEYLSLVNRLDRETSGTMLIAKNKASASFYFNKMREREIEKEYLVLVHGLFNHDIDARGWLVKDSNSIIRKKRKFLLDLNALPEDQGDEPDREFSHSSFTAITSDENYSLLKCRIFTGRTHQIRATICSLGYPVVGDKIYGLDDSYFFKFINDTLTVDEKAKLVISNQALHSYKTRTPMLSGDWQLFTSPPPDNWPIHF
ncbi:MAG: RluA family pseudouridine synthase [Spirochaetaceae bacterium]|nr:RluA family pseudouridine synthase [Spirochaetaceae bacterium]